MPKSRKLSKHSNISHYTNPLKHDSGDCPCGSANVIIFELHSYLGLLKDLSCGWNEDGVICSFCRNSVCQNTHENEPLSYYLYCLVCASHSMLLMSFRLYLQYLKMLLCPFWSSTVSVPIHFYYIEKSDMNFLINVYFCVVILFWNNMKVHIRFIFQLSNVQLVNCNNFIHLVISSFLIHNQTWLFKIGAFKCVLSLKKRLYRLDFPPDPTETTINRVLIAIQCVCLSIHTVNRTLFITASSKIGLHLSLSADGVLVFVLPLNFSPPEPVIMTPNDCETHFYFLSHSIATYCSIISLTLEAQCLFQSTFCVHNLWND